MAQASNPVIRNIEYIRLKDAKHGEALDSVRILIGNLQDALAAATARIAALENAAK